jgi:GTP cyclohydrolase IA
MVVQAPGDRLRAGQLAACPESGITMMPSPRHPGDQQASSGNGRTPGPGCDLVAAETAAAAFLAALGIDLSDAHTTDTPVRMARAYAELLTPRPFDWALFDADGYAGLVMVAGVRFASLCEHHALPFTGAADVGYLPGERIAGVSKLARLVEESARRPQVQERMTTQIADRLEEELQPRGVAVRLRAEHLCMTVRGAQARGAAMITSVVRGQLANDADLRSEWLRGTSQQPA